MQELNTKIEKYFAEKQHCLSVLEKTRNALENENFILLDSLLGVFLGAFGEEEILNFSKEEERTIPFGEISKWLEKTLIEIVSGRVEEEEETDCQVEEEIVSTPMKEMFDKFFEERREEARKEYIKEKEERKKKNLETLNIHFEGETEITKEFYRIKINAIDLLENLYEMIRTDDFSTIEIELNNKDTISFIEDDGEGCELGALIKRLRFLKSLEWNDDN